jgi:hypothetical protein
MAKQLSLTLSLLLFVAISKADNTNVAPSAPSPNPTPSIASGTIPSGGNLTLTPTNDEGMGSDGTAQDVNGYQVRIGELYSPGGEAYIIPILLPTLPGGQQFKSLHFRVQVMAVNNDSDVSPLANADLYALGLRNNSTAATTDYYQGGSPDPNATVIQANFLTPQSPVRTDSVTGPFVETSAAADGALLKYLNGLYAKGGAAGKYLILRISYGVDPIPAGNNAYELLTGGAKVDQEKPTLIYTLEPKK